MQEYITHDLAAIHGTCSERSPRWRTVVLMIEQLQVKLQCDIDLAAFNPQSSWQEKPELDIIFDVFARIYEALRRYQRANPIHNDSESALYSYGEESTELWFALKKQYAPSPQPLEPERLRE